MCVCASVGVRACVCAYVHACVCICVRASVSVCACVHACMCLCVLARVAEYSHSSRAAGRGPLCCVGVSLPCSPLSSTRPACSQTPDTNNIVTMSLQHSASLSACTFVT